ncbi:MAG: hypothetical protein NVS3B24_22120 [Candidatus Dormibacteria bacterium]
MDLDATKARARDTYDAAADHFDAAPLSFWARIGQRTVDRLRLAAGNRVLDVCCGSGATAIPAAQAVGNFGTVVGVDLAENLLALARAKAAVKALRNVEFRCQDVERMGFPRASCDAVICQFGIFFLPNMEAGVKLLWSLLAPGGQLAITTWGPRVFEPGISLFWEEVGHERPDLVRAFNPWERISTPGQLAHLFLDAGAPTPVVEEESSTQALASADDFWTILRGSGTRSTIDALGPEAAERVRRATVDRLTERGILEVETNVVYAVASRPPSA